MGEDVWCIQSDHLTKLIALIKQPLHTQITPARGRTLLHTDTIVLHRYIYQLHLMLHSGTTLHCTVTYTIDTILYRSDMVYTNVQ